MARVALSEVQDKLIFDCTNHDLIQLESQASRNLETALLEEEKLLLQKSRVKWLNVGDGNNRYFFNKKNELECEQSLSY